MTTCDGRFIRDLASSVFTGSWPCRHPLPRTFQHSGLPEGRQVLSINHIVQALSHSDQSYQPGNSGDTPEIQVPREGRHYRAGGVSYSMKPKGTAGASSLGSSTIEVITCLLIPPNWFLVHPPIPSNLTAMTSTEATILSPGTILSLKDVS